MKITACPKCGSRKIYQGRLRDGVITGYNSRDVCRDCGYQGSPIIFDNIDEYHKFELEKKSNKTLDEIPDDKKLDDEIVLSEKDKEVVDFLKDAENEAFTHETKSKIMKNPATTVGFALFIVGILISFVTFLYAAVLFFGGILLFFIGLFGSNEENLKQEECIKKMEKYPKIAGIILIVNAIFNGFLYLILLIFALFYDQIYQLYPKMESISLVMGQYQSILIVFFAVGLVFCFLSLVGGIFALLKERWLVALLGSIFGMLLINIFYIPSIISFIALVLIAFSRFVFEK